MKLKCMHGHNNFISCSYLLSSLRSLSLILGDLGISKGPDGIIDSLLLKVET